MKRGGERKKERKEEGECHRNHHHASPSPPTSFLLAICCSIPKAPSSHSAPYACQFVDWCAWLMYVRLCQVESVFFEGLLKTCCFPFSLSLSFSLDRRDTCLVGQP